MWTRCATPIENLFVCSLRIFHFQNSISQPFAPNQRFLTGMRQAVRSLSAGSKRP